MESDFAAGALSASGRLVKMQSARAVFAKLAVPAIAITRDPGIEMLREKMDAGNEQQPRKKIPTVQRESDAGPGVRTGINASVEIDGLHPTHGFFEIDLRKARGHGGVVEVEEFDAAARVHTADAVDARAAQAAGAIIEDCKLGQCSPRLY